ncbi:MAG: hypothetical protein AUJ12_09930 [Alphaproteobacteria bacterium CG1_02_46_17]|nr:MAG: hypothetical protein AUJ12_09930 [Alphaproteobacteria bacterium CG1_02_46_17]
MTKVIDRRQERPSGRHLDNEDRVKRRQSDVIRDHIRKQVNNSSIKTFGKDGVVVPIPKRNMRLPVIHHGNKEGVDSVVRPGNKKFNTGDMFPKPKGGGGGGVGPGEASNDGEGEDPYIYVKLSIKEVLSILFEGAELPNLSKEGGWSLTQTESVPDGFATRGPQSRMDLSRTFANKKGEELVRGRIAEKNILRALMVQYGIVKSYANEEIPNLDIYKPVNQISMIEGYLERVRPTVEDKISPVDKDLLERYDVKLKALNKLGSVSDKWREEQMNFRREIEKPVPVRQAVMFCIMDVSGSMDEQRKEIAKSFFGLLNAFLETKYEKLDVVFIRHTTEADEVDEDTFFYDRKSGGTLVSTSIQKMKEIIAERYDPSIWNIYAAQASDGDNWDNDNSRCLQLLDEELPLIQGYFYVEVAENSESNLWGPYEQCMKRHADRFFMARASSPADIIPVFSHFFKKTGAPVAKMEMPAWMPN